MRGEFGVKSTKVDVFSRHVPPWGKLQKLPLAWGNFGGSRKLIRPAKIRGNYGGLYGMLCVAVYDFKVSMYVPWKNRTVPELRGI